MKEILSLALQGLEKYLSLEESRVKEPQPMTWPSRVTLLSLYARKWRMEGYGNVTTIETTRGLQKLATIVMTPSKGIDVPLCMVTVTSLGKKKTVSVEYYNLCGCDDDIVLLDLCQKYSYVKDRKEKDGWHVREKAKYSVSKECTSDSLVQEIIQDEVDAYGQLCVSAIAKGSQRTDRNKRNLETFQKRLLLEGNPSLKALARVLGKEKAERFFQKVILPLEKEG